MADTGHVRRGGAPYVVRLSPTVTLTKLSVGPMDNNAYHLRSTAGATLLVDAANDAESILDVVGPERRLDAIVTTHRHRDHWEALSQVQAATAAALVCGRGDVDAVATGAWVENVLPVWDGDEVALGEESLAVVGLVGHTPGSIALIYRSPDGVAHVFTGDSLFPGGVGKTGSPEDFQSLLHDVETKLFTLPDDTVVYPGHGDNTTIGAERPQLEEWRARGW